MNRINTCETIALYQDSSQNRAGTTLGMMKHRISFSGTKYLKDQGTRGSKITICFSPIPLIHSLCVELNHRIRENVAHVNLFSLPQHLRVLVHHQPATMREPEAPLCIVRVSNSLGVFVVHAVITNPIVDRILSSYGVAKGQDNSQRQLGFVRAMSPKAMATASDAKASDSVGHDAPEDCEELQFEGDLKQSQNSEDVPHWQDIGVDGFHFLLHWKEAPHFMGSNLFRCIPP